MSLAKRLEWYLGQNHVDYVCVRHEHSDTQLEAAQQCHVPSWQVAKCVLLEDERGYVNAVLPANRRIRISSLREQLERNLELAGEEEIEDIFFDCDPGAIPGITAAYGIPSVIDRQLLDSDEIFIEGGDHESLVHMSGDDFVRLTSDSMMASFSARI